MVLPVSECSRAGCFCSTASFRQGTRSVERKTPLVCQLRTAGGKPVAIYSLSVELCNLALLAQQLNGVCLSVYTGTRSRVKRVPVLCLK